MPLTNTLPRFHSRLHNRLNLDDMPAPARCPRPATDPVADGDAMRRLRVIAGLFQATKRAADEFLDEHPDGCRCDWCRSDEKRAGWLVQDLEGLSWQAEMGGSVVRSVLTGEVPEDGFTLVEDLRAMADLWADDPDAPPARPAKRPAPPADDAPGCAGGRLTAPLRPPVVSAPGADLDFLKGAALNLIERLPDAAERAFACGNPESLFWDARNLCEFLRLVWGISDARA